MLPTSLDRNYCKGFNVVYWPYFMSHISNIIYLHHQLIEPSVVIVILISSNKFSTTLYVHIFRLWKFKNYAFKYNENELTNIFVLIIVHYIDIGNGKNNIYWSRSIWGYVDIITYTLNHTNMNSTQNPNHGPLP